MPKNRLFTILVLLVSIVMLPSCASKPAFELPKFLAPKTPTLTATSTATPLPAYKTFTPTFTPMATDTPSPTPTPALALIPCSFLEDCPGMLDIQSYIPEQVGSGNSYNVDIPFDQPLSVRTAWLIYEPGVVEKNLDVFRFFFEIDGQDYARQEDVGVSAVQDLVDPSISHLTVGIGYILDGWKVGETHTVHIGYEFLDKVTDAGVVMEPGTMFHYTYIINPVVVPTATPTATATNTPIPQPTAVPPTLTPACELGTSIVIKNDTGGQVTMYFTGPAKYTFYIAAGTQTLNLCSGQYSYTAYGCGNASISGTAGDGDEIEFWCE